MPPRLKQRIVSAIESILNPCNQELDHHQTNLIWEPPVLTQLSKTEFTILKFMASNNKERLYSTTNYLQVKSIESPSSNLNMKMECSSNNSKKEMRLSPCINRDGPHRPSPSMTNSLKVLIFNSRRKMF